LAAANIRWEKKIHFKKLKGNLLPLSRDVDSLKSSSTLKCSKRVICQLVLQSC
jgi:hypothetical protein